MAGRKKRYRVRVRARVRVRGRRLRRGWVGMMTRAARVASTEDDAHLPGAADEYELFVVSGTRWSTWTL